MVFQIMDYTLTPYSGYTRSLFCRRPCICVVSAISTILRALQYEPIPWKLSISSITHLSQSIILQYVPNDKKILGAITMLMTGVLLRKKLKKHEEQPVMSLILRASIWDQALMAHKLQQNCNKTQTQRAHKHPPK